MSSRLLMGSSAVFLAVLGVAASFLPQEIATWGGTQAGPGAVLMIQIAGALALGFAMLNWTGRGLVMGGLYGRPVALGNFLHFAAGGVALAKAVLGGQNAPAILAAAVAYAIFGTWFGVVLFAATPKKT